MSFKVKVYKIVSQIPKGKVMTYASVAKAAGNPRAARAVGNILNKNQDFETVPCHRVIRSDGRVGGYVMGKDKKIKKLEEDGVVIKNKIIDLEKYVLDLNK